MKLKITALTALLTIGLLTSCSEQTDDIETESENAYLNLNFSTASSSSTRSTALTRTGEASDADLSPANPTQESDIHTIKIWVFKSGSDDNSKAIAYKEESPKTTDGKVANETTKLSIRFLKKIDGEEVKDIDLYILANSESTNMAEKLSKDLGKTDFKSLTRRELKKAMFDNPFGIKKDGTAETTAVPEGKGLPISRAVTGISVSDHVADTEAAAASKGISIPLTRAISKLHFFFARKTDGKTDNVEVTKIVVNGETIPTDSYIFPSEENYDAALSNKNATREYSEDTQYEHQEITLAGVANSQIASVSSPTDYKRGENETATQYLERLEKAKITSQDLCYLRETPKAIKGTIYYRLTQGGAEKSTEFTIPSNGKAIRNRELLIYGYFEKGEMGSLYIQPTVADWVDGGSYNWIDATTGVEINENDTTEWGYKVYYGFPERGPLITLKDIDTNGKPWILQTNNPMFGFVVCDNEKGEYKKEVSVKDDDILNPKEIGKTYKIEDFIINESGEKKTLYFYVVPKNRLDLAKPHEVKAEIFLTKYPNDKFIINRGLKYRGCTSGKNAGKDLHFEQVL